MPLKSQQVFDTMGKALASNPAIVEKLKAVYQFTITDEAGSASRAYAVHC